MTPDTSSKTPVREIKFRCWSKNRKEMEYDCGHKVDPDLYELMQYTGLREHCNDDTSLNKEIYDGDIIQFINGERLAVEYNDDTCQFQFSDGSPINDGDRYATYKMIVGNIFEHPELLS